MSALILLGNQALALSAVGPGEVVILSGVLLWNVEEDSLGVDKVVDLLLHRLDLRLKLTNFHFVVLHGHGDGHRVLSDIKL